VAAISNRLAIVIAVFVMPRVVEVAYRLPWSEAFPAADNQSDGSS
jgi:hypothetical protein